MRAAIARNVAEVWPWMHRVNGVVQTGLEPSPPWRLP